MAQLATQDLRSFSSPETRLASRKMKIGFPGACGMLASDVLLLSRRSCVGQAIEPLRDKCKHVSVVGVQAPMLSELG